MLIDMPKVEAVLRKGLEVSSLVARCWLTVVSGKNIFWEVFNTSKEKISSGKNILLQRPL